MTSNARAWLRDELRGDLDAARQRSPAAWLAVTVETVAVGAVIVRVVAASWIYAINHGQHGAELNPTLRGEAMHTDCWRATDELQVSAFGVWAAVFFYSWPGYVGGPLWAEAWLAINAAALGVVAVVAVVRFLSERS